jgi:hypothetical protein
MAAVASFGRVARFDYLTMLQKLELAPIRPGSPYLVGSTEGPIKGARLLLQDGSSTRTLKVSQLDQMVRVVGRYLGVGMQEMEDSLCNWQKSPSRYVHFGG